MSQSSPAGWTLIAVLFSTQPLTATLAALLHRNAYEMYRGDESDRALDVALARGRIENLRRDMLLGTIAGPAFEARFDTEWGAHTVTFLLTRRGIELASEQTPSSQLN